MAKPPFPENFVEHGKEYNFRSNSDYEKLPDAERQKYKLIEAQKKTELEKIKADNERYRDPRIKEEKARLLRARAAKRNGPLPVIDGRRADRDYGLTAAPLSPEERRNLERTAERNVRQQEERNLDRVDKAFTQAQRDLLDRVLGPDRYPRRSR